MRARVCACIIGCMFDTQRCSTEVPTRAARNGTCDITFPSSRTVFALHLPDILGAPMPGGALRFPSGVAKLRAMHGGALCGWAKQTHKCSALRSSWWLQQFDRQATDTLLVHAISGLSRV